MNGAAVARDPIPVRDWLITECYANSITDN